MVCVFPQATERLQHLQTPRLPPMRSRGFDQITWPALKEEALWYVLVPSVPPVSYKAGVLPSNRDIRRQDGQRTHRQELPRVLASGTRDNQRCCHDTVCLDHAESAASMGWSGPTLVLGCRQWAVIRNYGFPGCVSSLPSLCVSTLVPSWPRISGAGHTCNHLCTL